MAGHLDFIAGTIAPLRHHPEDEFNVISGRFECTVNGIRRMLEPGDDVRVLPNQVHSLHAVEQVPS